MFRLSNKKIIFHYILLSGDLIFGKINFRFQKKTREGSDSQLVSIGALIPAIPWILRNAHKSEDECAHETMEFIKCTHPVTALIPFVDIYSRLLQAVLKGSDLRQEVLKVLSHSELGGPGKREGVLRLLDKAAR